MVQKSHKDSLILKFIDYSIAHFPDRNKENAAKSRYQPKSRLIVKNNQTAFFYGFSLLKVSTQYP